MKITKPRKEKVIEALRSWGSCNRVMGELTEPEVLAALNAERHSHKRADMVIRFHARYTKLRAIRERQELLAAL